jgi:hypothetical protein
MTHVDCIGRIPALSILTINIREADWLLAAQMQDDEICRIRDILLSNDRYPSNKVYRDHYKLKGNIVYRKLENTIKWLVPRANR